MTRTSLAVSGVSDGAYYVHLPPEPLGSSTVSTWLPLRQSLLTAAQYFQGTVFIVNLERVPTFGASFLSVLVELHRELHVKSCRLVVVGDQMGIVHAARLHQLFETYPSLADVHRLMVATEKACRAESGAKLLHDPSQITKPPEESLV